MLNAPVIWKSLANDVVQIWVGIGQIVQPFVTLPWIGIEMKIVDDPKSMSKWNYMFPMLI